MAQPGREHAGREPDLGRVPAGRARQRTEVGPARAAPEATATLVDDVHAGGLQRDIERHVRGHAGSPVRRRAPMRDARTVPTRQGRLPTAITPCFSERADAAVGEEEGCTLPWAGPGSRGRAGPGADPGAAAGGRVSTRNRARRCCGASRAPPEPCGSPRWRLGGWMPSWRPRPPRFSALPPAGPGKRRRGGTSRASWRRAAEGSDTSAARSPRGRAPVATAGSPPGLARTSTSQGARGLGNRSGRLDDLEGRQGWPPSGAEPNERSSSRSMIPATSSTALGAMLASRGHKHREARGQPAAGRTARDRIRLRETAP